MLIKSALFVKSSKALSECPKPEFPEYAFTGRSNVGKSSLINIICGKKGLAKTSVTPGKTRLINHFIINESWYIADLPGYGYAKISRETRAKWEKTTNNYLLKRENLMSVFILVDLRIEPQQSDLEIINRLGKKEIPIVIIFTKADKIKKSEVSVNKNTFLNKLCETWEQLPPHIVSSSKTELGKSEILDFIENTNKAFIKING